MNLTDGRLKTNKERLCHSLEVTVGIERWICVDLSARKGKTLVFCAVIMGEKHAAEQPARSDDLTLDLCSPLDC